jgi:hypothetical protein
VTPGHLGRRRRPILCRSIEYSGGTAALAVKLAGPVLAAVGEVVYVLVIVVAVTTGVGAISLVGLLIWRWRRTHMDAARARPPLHGAVVPPLHGEARAAQPLPAPRPAIEQHVHHHWHGVSAKDVAASCDARTSHDWRRLAKARHGRVSASSVRPHDRCRACPHARPRNLLVYLAKGGTAPGIHPNSPRGRAWTGTAWRLAGRWPRWGARGAADGADCGPRAPQPRGEQRARLGPA